MIFVIIITYKLSRIIIINILSSQNKIFLNYNSKIIYKNTYNIYPYNIRKLYLKNCVKKE